MRVLIATPLYPPEIGGPATYTRVLETELPKRGVGVITVPFSSVRAWPKALRHLAYFIKVHDAASDADIIYAQDPVATGLPAFLAARLLRKYFYLKVVGDRAWEEEQRRRPSNVDPLEFQIRRFGLVTELRRFVERFVAKRAAVVIVPSEYLKKVVLLWGVEPKHILVVRNGIPPVSLPLREEARAALSLDEMPLIVSVGRLSPWKGFPAVIASLVLTRARGVAAKLVIVGSGTDSERKRLEDEIRQHGLEDSVVLAGAVPRETVFQYLAACDAFVLNTFYEGFSHQILEAMAAGVPIITTAAGGNAEVLKDGHNARIIPWNGEKEIAQAIVEILTDKTLAARLAATAKEESAPYTEEAMVDGLLANMRI